MGLAFVLFLAALQDVPRDLYEAAAVDGASRLRSSFRHVTLPHLRPTRQHGGDAAADRDHADLQPGLRDDQWRPGRLVVVGDLLHLPDRRSSADLLGFASAVSMLLFLADPRGHHRAAAASCGSACVAESAPPRRSACRARGSPSPTCRIWLVGMAFVVAWAAPFVWMVSTSFKPSVAGDDARRSNGCRARSPSPTIAKVLEYPVATWALNSVIVATVATALCVLFGAMAGYALARLRFPGRRLCLPALPRLDDDPAGGRRRAAAPRHDQDRLGEHLPGADPADDRQRARRLHLPPVLPDLPARDRRGGDHRRRRARSASSSASRCRSAAQPADRRDASSSSRSTGTTSSGRCSSPSTRT